MLDYIIKNRSTVSNPKKDMICLCLRRHSESEKTQKISAMQYIITKIFNFYLDYDFYIAWL